MGILSLLACGLIGLAVLFGCRALLSYLARHPLYLDDDDPFEADSPDESPIDFY